jgi:hypothetical protein
MYSISIDNGPTSQIDVYNKTATGNDPPILLYSTTSLSNAVHEVNITNLLDSRTKTYGQMNVNDFMVFLLRSF